MTKERLDAIDVQLECPRQQSWRKLVKVLAVYYVKNAAFFFSQSAHTEDYLEQLRFGTQPRV